MKAIVKLLPPPDKEKMLMKFRRSGPKPTMDKMEDRLFAVTHDVDVPEDAEYVAEYKPRNPVPMLFQIMDYAGERYYREEGKKWFKILGELSPNATWVEDGDEIEVRIDENAANVRVKHVDVKCPTCNTYH